MAGILRVDQIKNTSASGNIEIPTGYKLVAADAGAISAPGTVIQVVNNEPYTTTASGTTISGTTYAEVTDLSTSITKKATSSKIICISSVMFGSNYSGAVWGKGKAERNGTFVYETAFYDHVQYGSGIENKPIFNFSDDTTSISAGTTLTYRFYFASENASGSIIFNWNGNSSNRTTSSIMLMEIAQ